MEDRDILIWKHLDGNITPDENLSVNELLLTDEAFSKSYDKAKKIHLSLKEQALDSPSMSFTSNLMKQVTGVKVVTDQNSFKKFFIILFSAMALAYSIYYILPGHGTQTQLINTESLRMLNSSLIGIIPQSSVYVFILISMLLFYWVDRLVLTRLISATQ